MFKTHNVNGRYNRSNEIDGIRIVNQLFLTIIGAANHLYFIDKINNVFEMSNLLCYKAFRFVKLFNRLFFLLPYLDL